VSRCPLRRAPAAGRTTRCIGVGIMHFSDPGFERRYGTFVTSGCPLCGGVYISSAPELLCPHGLVVDLVCLSASDQIIGQGRGGAGGALGADLPRVPFDQAEQELLPGGGDATWAGLARGDPVTFALVPMDRRRVDSDDRANRWRRQPLVYQQEHLAARPLGADQDPVCSGSPVPPLGPTRDADTVAKASRPSIWNRVSFVLVTAISTRIQASISWGYSG